MPRVIITGAGSGIGAATALRLDRQGWQVFAGVHDPADGDILAGHCSERLRVRALDVTDQASIDEFFAAVEKDLRSSRLAALVNNAGIGVAGPMETLPIGAVRVTQRALPLSRQGEADASSRVVFERCADRARTAQAHRRSPTSSNTRSVPITREPVMPAVSPQPSSRRYGA